MNIKKVLKVYPLYDDPNNTVYVITEYVDNSKLIKLYIKDDDGIYSFVVSFNVPPDNSI